MVTGNGQSGETSLMEELRRYLEYVRQFRQLAEQTITAYRNDGESFVRWCEAQGLGLAPAEITQAVLMRYLGDQGGLSANTLRRRVHALSGWFRFMMREGVMNQNPAEGLPLPKRSRRSPSCPSAEEVARLVHAARTPLERAAIALLAGAGSRRAELIGLDTQDVADDLSEIRVLGKGARERSVPLPPAVQDRLAEYIAQRGEAPGPLLLNRAGNRLGVTSLRRLFERLIRRAGVEDADYSLHSMRHSYATNLIRTGADLAVVRDLLGHTDVATTSIYLHSSSRSRREAVERLPLGLPGGEETGPGSEAMWTGGDAEIGVPCRRESVSDGAAGA